jgi:hypothetical protein
MELVRLLNDSWYAAVAIAAIKLECSMSRLIIVGPVLNRIGGPKVEDRMVSLGPVADPALKLGLWKKHAQFRFLLALTNLAILSLAELVQKGTATIQSYLPQFRLCPAVKSIRRRNAILETSTRLGFHVLVPPKFSG